MKKVNDYSLNWSYKDTFNKVVNQVQMKSDFGYKINIKEEEKLNQDQIDFFHEICQEAIEIHSEEIIELINDLVMDYVADNEYEIMDRVGMMISLSTNGLHIYIYIYMYMYIWHYL